MPDSSATHVSGAPPIVLALGEAPRFAPGTPVRILTRQPIGHYRVPIYLRGKQGVVEKVIEPAAVDNEEEAYGRNAGKRRHYYRLSLPMAALWPQYAGSPQDRLHVEVFENWLEEAQA